MAGQSSGAYCRRNAAMAGENVSRNVDANSERKARRVSEGREKNHRSLVETPLDIIEIGRMDMDMDMDMRVF